MTFGEKRRIGKRASGRKRGRVELGVKLMRKTHNLVKWFNPVFFVI